MAGRVFEVVDLLGNSKVYFRDVLGRVLFEDTYDPAGDLVDYQKFIYDLGGNAIRVEQYSGDYTLYEYNALGKVVDEQVYEADNTPREWQTTEYDLAGNATVISNFRGKTTSTFKRRRTGPLDDC